MSFSERPAAAHFVFAKRHRLPVRSPHRVIFCCTAPAYTNEHTCNDIMSPSTQGEYTINQPRAYETAIPWTSPPEPANPVVKGLPLHYGSILYVPLPSASTSASSPVYLYLT